MCATSPIRRFFDVFCGGGSASLPCDHAPANTGAYPPQSQANEPWKKPADSMKSGQIATHIYIYMYIHTYIIPKPSGALGRMKYPKWFCNNNARFRDFKPHKKPRKKDPNGNYVRILVFLMLKWATSAAAPHPPRWLRRRQPPRFGRRKNNCWILFERLPFV